MLLSPYTAPNPIDTVIYMQDRMCNRLPRMFFRVGEIFACLQTIDEAMHEVYGKSKRRDAAIDTWRELAGDLLHGVSMLNLLIYAGAERPAIAPFRMARKDFPYRGNPLAHCTDIPNLLTLMAAAARFGVGDKQRYTDNFHGVIFYQLWQLHAVQEEACAEFHDKIIRLPMPASCNRLGLVYPREYDPDTAPRNSEDSYDISDYEGAPHF